MRAKLEANDRLRFRVTNQTGIKMKKKTKPIGGGGRSRRQCSPSCRNVGGVVVTIPTRFGTTKIRSPEVARLVSNDPTSIDVVVVVAVTVIRCWSLSPVSGLCCGRFSGVRCAV